MKMPSQMTDVERMIDGQAQADALRACSGSVQTTYNDGYGNTFVSPKAPATQKQMVGQMRKIEQELRDLKKQIDPYVNAGWGTLFDTIEDARTSLAKITDTH